MRKALLTFTPPSTSNQKISFDKLKEGDNVMRIGETRIIEHDSGGGTAYEWSFRVFNDNDIVSIKELTKGGDNHKAGAGVTKCCLITGVEKGSVLISFALRDWSKFGQFSKIEHYTIKVLPETEISDEKTQKRQIQFGLSGGFAGLRENWICIEGDDCILVRSAKPQNQENLKVGKEKIQEIVDRFGKLMENYETRVLQGNGSDTFHHNVNFYPSGDKKIISLNWDSLAEIKDSKTKAIIDLYNEIIKDFKLKG